MFFRAYPKSWTSVGIDANQDYLLYDFSADIGDTVITFFPGTRYRYHIIDTIYFIHLSSGDSLKTIDISVYESDTTSNVPQGFIRNTTWYEGIGSQTYILEPMFDYLIGFEHITNLYCYRDTVQGIQYEPFIVFNVDTGIHCNFNPPISIHEFAEKQEDVLIYPNPFSDKFFIESSGKILGSTFQIYDLQGKLMYEGIIYEQKTQIYTDKLSSGFYLVKIQNDHVIFTRKLFKP